MKTVQDFNSGACEVCPNEDDMTCMVYVDVDGGWDSTRQAYQDVEYFADGDNDPMGEDIEDCLAQMGLELIFPGTLVGDETVEFKMRRV